MHYLTPSQCRAARGLLDWSQPDLASRCDIHIQTISSFEKSLTTPSKRTLKKISDVFESQNIEFLESDGLRRKESPIICMRGRDGFQAFLDDVYNTAIEYGTSEKPVEIYLSNVHHLNWIKWMGEDLWHNHVDRMTRDKALMDVRIIVREGDKNFPAAAYSKYKWVPEKIFNEKSFYSYHNKLAFLNFQHDDVEITIIQQVDFANGYRQLFLAMWDNIARDPK
jgi:transcriptional regulator with XRE-family HTH domain